MNTPTLQLDRKSIVVIGGTTGLGLSAAQAFVAQGAKVVVMGRNADSAQAAADTLGSAGHAVVGDATDSKSCDQAVAAAVQHAGQLDALYHVAGGSGRKQGDGPLHEITDAGIDFTLALNLKSVMLSNRAAVQQFRRQKENGATSGGGAILNMSSVLGFSPSPDFFATHVYAAAKAAIVGFTRSIAAYYANENIRCNVVAPALVETPMAQRAAKDDTIQAFIKTKQPLDGGRIGRADDLDAAAVYLLSNAARFVTGQTLAIDGGWCVSEGQNPGKTSTKPPAPAPAGDADA